MSRRRGSLPQPRLIWDGRRDPTEVAAAVVSVQAQVFPAGAAGSPSERRLIQGDNLGVMASLLSTHAGRFDLIYADPPFLTGKAFRARVGRGEDSRSPVDWRTTDGYADQWASPAEYLSMLEPRLRLMYELLSPSGTLYLHLDWHAAAYGRLLLDEIFGPDRLLNEIAWVYHGPSPIRRAFSRKHDTLLVYTKTDAYFFNAAAVRTPYDPSTLRTFAGSPRAGFGKVPDLERGKVPEDWWYFPVVARLHRERTGYPTQKPEALMTRVIAASSPPGGLVGDFFSGSGTTLIAAERLDRNWVGCDAHPLACHVAHHRLLLEPNCRPYQLETSHPESGPVRQVCATLERRGPETSVRLDGLRGPSGGLPDREAVEVWEVDWDYDGVLFRSRAQAVRAWRSSELVDRLACAGPGEAGRRVAVRAVDRDGRTGIAVLEGTGG